MQDSEIIDALGGTGRVAALLGIEPPSVSEWRKRGIPTARRQTLALMFPDVCPPDWRPSVDAQETAA
jgi:DNA-binding transcriptional regulator YdaS (Cro superfamily)